MKEKAKEEYCKKIIIFCLLYRECLNQLKDKLEEEKKNLPETVILQVEQQESEYCLENNAEQMPDICNDFIGSYLETWRDLVDIEEMKELTFHFCNWIFFNGFTCSLIHINAIVQTDVAKESNYNVEANKVSGEANSATVKEDPKEESIRPVALNDEGEKVDKEEKREEANKEELPDDKPMNNNTS